MVTNFFVDRALKQDIKILGVRYPERVDNPFEVFRQKAKDVGKFKPF